MGKMRYMSVSKLNIEGLSIYQSQNISHEQPKEMRFVRTHLEQNTSGCVRGALWHEEHVSPATFRTTGGDSTVLGNVGEKIWDFVVVRRLRLVADGLDVGVARVIPE